MKFTDLLERFGEQPYFDYPSVCLLSGESDEAVRTSLYRFKRSGKLLELRRGLYAFGSPFRKSPLNPAALAAALYSPSYLSELWALSWYGVIPEKTVLYTSVTPRSTRSFENTAGRFRYRSIRSSLFAGFRTEIVLGAPVRIATPEKALLDLWYLESGEWTAGRMASMRFDPHAIDREVLARVVSAAGNPRLDRALRAFIGYSDETGLGFESL